MMETRVNFGVLEDCRRAVFFELDKILKPREQSAVASRIASRLRDDGLLPGAVAALLGRSSEFVTGLIRTGDLLAARDGGGWLVPASSVQRWLDRHAFAVVEKSSRPIKKEAAAMGAPVEKNAGNRAGNRAAAARDRWPAGRVKHHNLLCIVVFGARSCGCINRQTPQYLKSTMATMVLRGGQLNRMDIVHH